MKLLAIAQLTLLFLHSSVTTKVINLFILSCPQIGKALELTSLVPLTQPSAAQGITIGSSIVTDIVAANDPQETHLNDTIQLWSENMPFQIKQSHTDSQLKPSSEKTFNPN